MDPSIEDALNCINKIIASSIFPVGKLIKTRELLQQLVQSDLSKNELYPLFCRQLSRLMKYNDTISNDFWIALQDDLLCILNGKNGGQQQGNSWEQFSKRIEFERRVEQRALQFQELFGERKTFRQLFLEHRNFLKKYLQKCISFHSNVQIRGLVKDIDDLLNEVCKVSGMMPTSEKRKYLQKELNHIKIPFNCSENMLNELDSEFFKSNNDSSNFFPSNKQIEMDSNVISESITNVLLSNRWVIILGEPGSGKTTLLRWLTFIFAKAADCGDERVKLNESDDCQILIPILIRIGEFVEWFDKNSPTTLIDYIGEHTWFSERYCDDQNGGSILKELIYHGHTLILLDGLDEISEINSRGEIVDVVREFIRIYVRAPDFISPLDDKLYGNNDSTYVGEVIEVMQPNRSGGDRNQIVITSRAVGYQLYPITSKFIKHYLLSLMNHSQAKEFVKEWMTQVEKSVYSLLENGGINLSEEIVRTLSNRRSEAVEAMFENESELLMSNPSLLSLICTSTFQLRGEFNPKSRVEVYYYTVQSALYIMTSQDASISESMIIHFLINLATYLHLNSSSGCIDEFDMERICGLTLKQQLLRNNRKELNKHVKRIISLLESNACIAVERGLQTYGFQHLSFQEYFVALSLVKVSFLNSGIIRSQSIDEIAKCIVSFTINPRFRESLRLALGWISWKWSSSSYNELCKLLVTPHEDNVIPFGTLLLFDAFDDLYTPPSKLIIFTGLNILLDHPLDIIKNAYLILYLIKLPDEIIKEWMHLYLTDVKIIFNFCQCLLNHSNDDDDTVHLVRWKKLYVVYEQLWLCHGLSASAKYIIDHTLRNVVLSNDITESIFNKALSPYIFLNDNCTSKIHPLILSVIIAICGGISFNIEDTNLTIGFSSKQMHRESSVIQYIIEYFNNNNDSHLDKVQNLIKQFEHILNISSRWDTSVTIVDTFIALICLQGVSKPLNYAKYDGYLGLSLALEQFKQIWFYLKDSFDTNRYKYYLASKMPCNSSEIHPTINMFFSQSNQSGEEYILFLIACSSAWKRFDNFDLAKLFTFNISCETLINSNVQNQLKFIHYINDGTFDRMIQKNINSTPIFQQNLCLLITLLPKSLQKLYYYLTIDPTQEIKSLPLIVLLLQCLTHLEDVCSKNLNTHVILPMLQPLLKEHLLENYATLLFWEQYPYSTNASKDHQVPVGLEENKQLYDMFHLDKFKNWEILIIEENQRINTVKNAIQNQKKDLQIFAASITLARLFRAQYRSCKSNERKQPHLINVIESKELFDVITNISDPILKIIVFTMILELKDPKIFDEIQRDDIRLGIIQLLQSSLSTSSLLTSTLLFIQCYSIRDFFPGHVQYMTGIIGDQLNQSSIDKERQEAAYIALRQLNSSDLSQYLSKFAKQTTNLSDILHFNSTIFHRNFSNISSINVLNTAFPSLMYLTELTFDVQNLKMYTEDDHRKKVLSIKEFQSLTKNQLSHEKILTHEIAIWVTNYLQMWNKEDLFQIISFIRRCLTIEGKTLSVIKKWLIYQKDEFLNFFAGYAALQLVIHGSIDIHLITMIEEMFSTDNNFQLASLVQLLFNSQYVDITTLRSILITLHQNINYFSGISAMVEQVDVLKLILDMELERINSKNSSRPFLLMIKDCSKDLQIFLKKHLSEILNQPDENIDTNREKYAAILTKWIIEKLVCQKSEENFSTELYQYILTLLHDQRFPSVQKAIINGLNSIFINQPVFVTTNVFKEIKIIRNLEMIVHSWNQYSEDVVAICLLSYGNCLLNLKAYQITYNVSNEIRNTITNDLFRSSSEIIVARATLCHIFIENRSITFSTISYWFENKPNITPEKRYNILFQQNLYNVTFVSNKTSGFIYNNISQHNLYNGTSTLYEIGENENETVKYLEIFFDEMFERFSFDLSYYLRYEDKINYLSDPTPNYIRIAQKFSKTNMTKFRNIIKEIFHSEENFNNLLSRYCKDNPSDKKASIELYTIFGQLTVELLDMLQNITADICEAFLSYKIRVYDREVIEKLFELLASTKSKEEFKCYLKLLKKLAEIHDVSLLEIHQKLSLIKNLPCDCDDELWETTGFQICQLLTNLSCFERDFLSVTDKQILAASDIEKAFEEEVEKFNKNSNFFSK